MGLISTSCTGTQASRHVLAQFCNRAAFPTSQRNGEDRVLLSAVATKGVRLAEANIGVLSAMDTERLTGEVVAQAMGIQRAGSEQAATLVLTTKGRHAG